MTVREHPRAAICYSADRLLDDILPIDPHMLPSRLEGPSH